MENVSKALMIAGGVLIAILVTTLLLGGLTRLRQYQNTQDTVKKNEQISEFNSKFESYNKQVITGYELISIGNMAEDTNERYRSEEGYVPVSVWIKPKNQSVPSECILGDFINTSLMKDGQYFNLIDFTDYFKNLDESNQENYEFQKKLKEAYFKCDKVEYDDKNRNGSGRIIKMKFSEMTKRNT